MSDQSLGGRLGFRRVVKLQVGGATKDQLLQMLAHHDVSLNEYARVLFDDDDFTTSSDARTVRLAIVSLPEIGLSEGGVYESILERASHLGLEPCALEVAAHLRLHLLEQPHGPYLTVASLELHPGTEQPNGFYLRRLDDGLWLRGYESGPENTYAPDFTDFVFSYPEQ